MATSPSETDDSSRHNLLRMRVTAEADLQSPPSVLERFTNLDVTPRRVQAWSIGRTMPRAANLDFGTAPAVTAAIAGLGELAVHANT